MGRTSDLPELTGLPHIIREIRYHEFSRQAIGILLIAVYSVWAAPRPGLYWIGAAIAVIGILFRFRNRTDGRFACKNVAVGEKRRQTRQTSNSAN